MPIEELTVIDGVNVDHIDSMANVNSALLQDLNLDASPQPWDYAWSVAGLANISSIKHANFDRCSTKIARIAVFSASEALRSDGPSWTLYLSRDIHPVDGSVGFDRGVMVPSALATVAQPLTIYATTREAVQFARHVAAVEVPSRHGPAKTVTRYRKGPLTKEDPEMRKFVAAQKGPTVVPIVLAVSAVSNASTAVSLVAAAKPESGAKGSTSPFASSPRTESGVGVAKPEVPQQEGHSYKEARY